MKLTTDSEPVAVVRLVELAVTNAVALLVAFGLDLTGEQVAAILGAATTVTLVVGAVITRRIVWAPATVEDVVRRVADTEGERYADPPGP